MKKNIILIICIIIGLIFNISVFGSKENLFTSKNELQKKDFEIAELKLGMPMTEISKVLGNPLKITTDKKKILCYNYPQLQIKSFYFEGAPERTADHIVILGKNIKTFRGIGVGDKEKDIFYHYGKTEKISERLTYETNFEINFYAISFLMSNGKVKQIDIYLAAD